MKVLYDAIYAKLAGSTLNTAIGGRLYFTEAPRGSVYPYVVYHNISDIYDWLFDNLNMELFRIQFSILSDNGSATELEDIFSKLIALYDWTALSVTGYTALYMRRIGSGPVVREDNGVWHKPVDFGILIHKRG